jgi:hypothetical protein|tara:strand:- start:2498 stop:2890 length:393 start_codon:yes stop_codon:yes gene_type:complete
MNIMDDMKKLIDKGNKEFLVDFMREVVQCGELSKLQGERIMKNDKLKHFFSEERDEVIETLEETAKELHNLKKKVKERGFEYLLDENSDDDELIISDSDCEKEEEYLMECNNCCRVWDGNAQCPCQLTEN